MPTRVKQRGARASLNRNGTVERLRGRLEKLTGDLPVSSKCGDDLAHELAVQTRRVQKLQRQIQRLKARHEREVTDYCDQIDYFVDEGDRVLEEAEQRHREEISRMEEAHQASHSKAVSRSNKDTRRVKRLQSRVAELEAALASNKDDYDHRVTAMRERSKRTVQLYKVVITNLNGRVRELEDELRETREQPTLKYRSSHDTSSEVGSISISYSDEEVRSGARSPALQKESMEPSPSPTDCSRETLKTHPALIPERESESPIAVAKLRGALREMERQDSVARLLQLQAPKLDRLNPRNGCQGLRRHSEGPRSSITTREQAEDVVEAQRQLEADRARFDAFKREQLDLLKQLRDSTRDVLSASPSPLTSTRERSCSGTGSGDESRDRADSRTVTIVLPPAVMSVAKREAPFVSRSELARRTSSTSRLVMKKHGVDLALRPLSGSTTPGSHCQAPAHGIDRVMNYIRRSTRTAARHRSVALSR